MKINKLLSITLLFSTILIFNNCKKGEKPNIFSIEDDKQMGAQMNQHLHDSLKTRILDRAQYPKSYTELDKIKNYILNSGKITYKSEFPWELYIIREDSTQNAFATPGGYIYVYTGLIKYLDQEDHLAGVMGHEMAHSDRRHSTNQMTKAYGLQTLFDIALGKNQGALSQVTQGLIGLKFSREAESEADEYSVRYLCQNPAQYQANGAAGFFQKLLDLDQAGNTPAFLSTHPSPANRVQDINNKAAELGCDTQLKSHPEFQDMKNELWPAGQ